MSLGNSQASSRVLVADDDPVIRYLFASVLKRDRYAPVVANDGREAYRIFQSDADFKAAIFDMMLPYLEGVDIIRHLRTEKRLMQIPVMMITSERDLKVVANSFAARRDSLPAKNRPGKMTNALTSGGHAPQRADF